MFDQTKDEFKSKKREIKSKRRERQQIRQELLAAKNWIERRQYNKRKRKAKQELLLLEDELRAAKHNRAEALAARQAPRVVDEAGSKEGALPDFAIIGARKAGTTFLYHLLTLHPYVLPAATKEPHFFGVYFDEGVEWYRQLFPAPRWKDGRRTITGEATPLMANPRAPQRMAQVVPRTRLIALLRNPVDRTYSDYYQLIKKGREARSFEEAIGLEAGRLNENSEYVSRGVYVDQLERWFEFFSDEQMLVLKSEDFFDDPVKTLKVVLEFLELPEWEPDASELPTQQNKGTYKQGMDPETRRKLEEYFEPHNKRLYEHLGVDFGW